MTENIRERLESLANRRQETTMDQRDTRRRERIADTGAEPGIDATASGGVVDD